MSEKNAYTGFIDMMSKKATEKMPTYFRTGTVKNGEDSGNLSVSIGGIEYTKSTGEVMKFVSCAGCGLCASCRACQYNTFSGECKMKIPVNRPFKNFRKLFQIIQISSDLYVLDSHQTVFLNAGLFCKFFLS